MPINTLAVCLVDYLFYLVEEETKPEGVIYVHPKSVHECEIMS